MVSAGRNPLRQSSSNPSGQGCHPPGCPEPHPTEVVQVSFVFNPKMVCCFVVGLFFYRKNTFKSWVILCHSGAFYPWEEGKAL